MITLRSGVVLEVGMRVATRLPGYRYEGTIATIEADARCSSGYRVALETPAACETCGHMPKVFEEYRNAFVPESSELARRGILPGVDADWLTPA